ncbi:MAG: VOC family protein [Thermoleophilaceae bacterium]|nr:VOC family protein [Thermoleophilaceae bacterium]
MSPDGLPHSKLSHVDLVVSSLERSLAFYTGLLRPLGWSRVSEIVGERGEKLLYISAAPPGLAAIGLREAQSPGGHDRYAIGIHHLCLDVLSREQVDERAQWLRAQGAEILSGPGEYDYTPGYYAVFFLDPDGIKLELLHRPGATTG